MCLVVGPNDHASLCAAERRFGSLHLLGRNAKAIAVAVEQDALALTLSAFGWFNPLAPTCALVHTLEKAQRAAFDVRAVVTSHDRLDSLCSFICVVKRNCADVMVEHVSLNNAMKDLAANESKFTVNRRSGAANVVPRCTSVVGKSWISVLEVGDRN